MIEELFDFWRQCARHPKARLDDDRTRRIRRALKWGYSLEDLKLAVLGCCRTPWYSEGANERGGVYTHISLILRDADHIDKFMKLGEQELLRCWHAARREEEALRSARERVREIPAEARAKITQLTGFRRHTRRQDDGD